MVLINDPETAVVLRDAFPQSFIVHWFQNQQSASRNIDACLQERQTLCRLQQLHIALDRISYYALPARSVQTLYNGVDTEHFRPAESETDD